MAIITIAKENGDSFVSTRSLALVRKDQQGQSNSKSATE